MTPLLLLQTGGTDTLLLQGGVDSLLLQGDGTNVSGGGVCGTPYIRPRVEGTPYIEPTLSGTPTIESC